MFKRSENPDMSGLKLKKIKFVLAILLISVFVLPQLCMTDITYGSEYVFNESYTDYNSAIALDATHTIIAFCDEVNSYYGTAVIATKSGSTISYGSKYVFNSGYTGVQISVTALDATHALIVYRDGTNFNYGTAVIATISGTGTGATISYSSEYIYNEYSSYNNSAIALDATHALIAYRDIGNSNYGTAVIATISGDSIITYGSEYVFNSANNNDIVATALDETHALITYMDFGNDYFGTGIIATISGDTISYGSEYVFNSAVTYMTSATALDETHALIAYKDDATSSFGTGIIATISGTGTGATIFYGSEYVFNNTGGDIFNLSPTALDATHALIAYYDQSVTSGTSMIATISGTGTGATISYGSEYVFNSAPTGSITATALDATHALISYRDNGYYNYGTGIIATFISVDVDDIGFDTKFKESKLENYPNPFRSRTKISYAINNRLKATPVEIRIYNVIGQLIETISATNGVAEWDAGNLPSGIYFYKLMIENSSEVNKMILIK